MGGGQCQLPVFSGVHIPLLIDLMMRLIALPGHTSWSHFMVTLHGHTSRSHYNTQIVTVVFK